MPRAVEEPPLKVCYVIPIYNEPYCELSATLRSIAENIEVWRRSDVGRSRNIDVTVVVVQDGWGACDASTKKWIETDLGCPSEATITGFLAEQERRIGQERGSADGVPGVAIFVPDVVRATAGRILRLAQAVRSR
jgi:hypothetical protein